MYIVTCIFFYVLGHCGHALRHAVHLLRSECGSSQLEVNRRRVVCREHHTQQHRNEDQHEPPSEDQSSGQSMGSVGREVSARCDSRLQISGRCKELSTSTKRGLLADVAVLLCSQVRPKSELPCVAPTPKREHHTRASTIVLPRYNI